MEEPLMGNRDRSREVRNAVICGDGLQTLTASENHPAPKAVGYKHILICLCNARGTFPCQDGAGG